MHNTVVWCLSVGQWRNDSFVDVYTTKEYVFVEKFVMVVKQNWSLIDGRKSQGWQADLYGINQIIG